MWICDTEFLQYTPFNTFHLQLDSSFSPPPHPEELKNFHWLVRQNFRRCGEECFLEISADDCCKCYCNGAFVLQGPAQAYPLRYPYLRFDLRPFLQEGENVLALHVYYHGCLSSRAWQSGDFRQGAWFRITAEDGRVLWESDRQCKAMRCTAWQGKETIGYDTQFVENIRADRIPQGWNTVAFDDSLWAPAVENPRDDHRLVLQQTKPIEFSLQAPKTMEQHGDTIFGDMGEEVTGSLCFRANASGCQTVLVRCGEELNPDGSVRYQMRCNCKYTNQWALSGRLSDTVEFFDYMAFRYFEIIAPPGIVDPASVAAKVRHYPMRQEDCVFETDNPSLNRVF